MGIKRYQTKVEDVLINMLKLKLRKDHDYNSSEIPRSMYYLHGTNTGVDEIYKKVLRLINLTSNKKQPKNETIEDTLYDIIGYSVDLIIFINENKSDREME